MFYVSEICEQCLLGRRDILLYSYTNEQMIVRRASEPTREPSPPVTTVMSTLMLNNTLDFHENIIQM
jgi:hypothetical protein